MTTTATYSEYETRTLAMALEVHQEEIAKHQTQVDAIRAELLHRIRAEGGRALMDDTFQIEVKETSGGFNPSVLVQLKELLPTEDLVKAWTPAHEETVTVPEKWDGRTLVAYARKYGGKVAEVVERARLEGRQTLVVERKK